MDIPTFKIITLGNYGVGKTCLLLKATDPEAKLPTKYHCTIGVDFKTKLFEIGEKSYKFAIWDTAGQERFHNINRLYYKDCHAVLLVYDITSRESFDRIHQLFEDFKSNSQGPSAFILVANKIDMPNREISRQESKNLADALGMPLIECSAVTGENIEKIFETLLGELQSKHLIRRPTESFIIKSKPSKKIKCC